MHVLTPLLALQPFNWHVAQLPWLICRSTELRLACSPDKAAHMVIREPAQCLYVITMYLPGLCHATQAASLNSPILVAQNGYHDEL